MRKRELFLGLVLAGATLAMEAPIASTQEIERVPIRLAAFLPRCPWPQDLKHMTSDDGAGCRGGLVLDNCEHLVAAERDGWAHLGPDVESIVGVNLITSGAAVLKPSHMRAEAGRPRKNRTKR
jgi:hypothetical protein